jgi:PilZ domain-containing protein
MPELTHAKKRMNPRYPFVAEAEITLQDGTWLPAQLCELSIKGCYVDTLEPLPVGTEFILSICDGMNSCELPGKVIYEHTGSGLGITGMGVLFGEVRSEQHSTLDSWMQSVAAPTSSRTA